MIGSIIFLMILAAGVFKMVYDHQLIKDKIKMTKYGQEAEETVEAWIWNGSKNVFRRMGRSESRKS